MSQEEHEKRARELLVNMDKETFERRAQNLSMTMLFAELDKLYGVQPLSKNIQDFHNEALSDFINGCFRSCIFSCASAVEQALKEELIIDSDDPEETLWEFEIKRTRFEEIVRKARNDKRLSKIVDKADNLRKLRNEIAVHPMQVPFFPEPKTKERIILTNMTMIRSTRKILTFLDPKFAENVKNADIGVGDEKKKLVEILQDPITPEIGLVWEALQSAVLRNLAVSALDDMSYIMRELHGKKKESSGEQG